MSGRTARELLSAAGDGVIATLIVVLAVFVGLIAHEVWHGYAGGVAVAVVVLSLMGLMHLRRRRKP